MVSLMVQWHHHISQNLIHSTMSASRWRKHPGCRSRLIEQRVWLYLKVDDHNWSRSFRFQIGLGTSVNEAFKMDVDI